MTDRTVMIDGISLAQEKIGAWARHVFSDEERVNAPERVLRFVEEAVELAQAAGVTVDQVHRLVDYVFGRLKGEAGQEIAGSLVTLLTAANSLGIGVAGVFAHELHRIWMPATVERIRLRQAEKRKAIG